MYETIQSIATGAVGAIIATLFTNHLNKREKLKVTSAVINKQTRELILASNLERKLLKKEIQWNEEFYEWELRVAIQNRSQSSVVIESVAIKDGEGFNETLECPSELIMGFSLPPKETRIFTSGILAEADFEWDAWIEVTTSDGRKIYLIELAHLCSYVLLSKKSECHKGDWMAYASSKIQYYNTILP